MEKLIKPSIWKIMKIFYDSRNSPLHLREISRKTKLNESSLSRHLNALVKNQILNSERDANLRKFSIYTKFIPEIFPLFDYERVEKLPLLRKNAIKNFLNKLEEKPVFVVIFGSTAKGSFDKSSDLDILVVCNSKINTNDAQEYAQHQTGIKIQIFQTTLKNFKENRVQTKDYVLGSAIETGFPVFNNKYFYEELYNG